MNDWKPRPIVFEVDKNGCFYCTSHKTTKYGYYQINVNRVRKLLHRYVYEEMFGEIPVGLVVRHKCDNRSCINPEHLELGTQVDNIRDMVERGRSAKGEKHSQAKLTENEVREIKRLINTGMKNTEIRKKLGNVFSRKHISDIKCGRSWSHVQ